MVGCRTVTGARPMSLWTHGRGWAPHRAEGDQSWRLTRRTHESWADWSPRGGELYWRLEALEGQCGGLVGACVVWLGIHGVWVVSASRGIDRCRCRLRGGGEGNTRTRGGRRVLRCRHWAGQTIPASSGVIL